jgi:DNA-binding protein YbaB
MLEDLLVAAVNDAVQAREVRKNIPSTCQGSIFRRA